MTEASKARREAATLFCVVFLLGALLGGFGTHLWAQHVSGQQTATQPQLRRGLPPRDQVVANFTRELQLTPDQQQQLGAIIDSTQAKVRALYPPVEAQREEIRSESHERIRAILTPGQIPAFDDFMHRLDEQRKKDGR
jgi:Spy/CpxP family protein refolding chaperone